MDSGKIKRGTKISISLFIKMRRKFWEKHYTMEFFDSSKAKLWDDRNSIVITTNIIDKRFGSADHFNIN